MADDEDWFERSLREGPADEGDGDEDDERSDDGDDSRGGKRATVDGEDDEDWFERGVAGDDPEPESAGPDDATETRNAGTVADAAGKSTGLFEEDFATAFAEAEGPDLAFGSGGGFVGGTEGSFDPDETFESNIPRLSLGIEGLDEMIQGGVPERSLMVCIGGAGTGKTTFGLQFLNHALGRGERAVFITLEQDRESLLATAAEFGWDFPGYVAEERLAVVDIDPVEMANSLASIRNELPALIDEFGATRLVLDSVSLLELMYDDQAARRTEVYDFTRSLKGAGVTTMLTSEASTRTPYASRHGIIEYLTDAVFVLRYIRPEDFRETRLAIEIQKIRDANHSREMKPYEITGEGISVYRQANIF